MLFIDNIYFQFWIFFFYSYTPFVSDKTIYFLVQTVPIDKLRVFSPLDYHHGFFTPVYQLQQNRAIDDQRGSNTTHRETHVTIRHVDFRRQASAHLATHSKRPTPGRQARASY